MSYNKNNLFNGILHFKVIEQLDKEKGSYSSEIADKLDKDQSLISEVIGQLEKLNLIKKGERTRAQYYETTEKGREYVKNWEKIKEIQRDVLDEDS